MKSFKLIFASLTFLTFILSSCKDNSLRICFDSDDRTPNVGQRVTFNAACSEGVDLYHWNFGDGNDTITKVPTVQHAFQAQGYYTISLHNTATQVVGECSPNGNGNIATTTCEVTQ